MSLPKVDEKCTEVVGKERYGAAWESLDSQAILDVFTEDGTYQETPLKEPFRGHLEIKQHWEEVVRTKERDVRFSLDNTYTDGVVGIAEWHTHFTRADNGNKEELRGIILAEVEGEKIKRLWEYWNKMEKAAQAVIKNDLALCAIRRSARNYFT